MKNTLTILLMESCVKSLKNPVKFMIFNSVRELWGNDKNQKRCLLRCLLIRSQQQKVIVKNKIHWIGILIKILGLKDFVDINREN